MDRTGSAAVHSCEHRQSDGAAASCPVQLGRCVQELNVTPAEQPCSSGSHVNLTSSSVLGALSRRNSSKQGASGWISLAEAASLQQVDRLTQRTAAGFRIPSFLRRGIVDPASRFTEASAAVEVQRLYRGYRTRRHLADIAVMARKYGWWNVVEAAMLKHSTEQYYAYNKPQTARERWTRIKRKAAKVGRGLAKDDRARKLAIQHWLEAIDARHRYGHNLHPYYHTWINSPTHEPFFYWLDIGEGKELDLDSCPRSLLNKEQIKYLSPKERKHYEVVVQDGKLYYKTSGELVDTPKGNKYIFVMSASGKFYIGQKEKGRFQHSSFLAGGATLAAGRLLVNSGTLELMEAHSGHYRPTEENFTALIEILTKMGADLTMAKVQTVWDDMLTTCSSKKDVECIDHSQQNDLVEGTVELDHHNDDGVGSRNLQQIEDGDLRETLVTVDQRGALVEEEAEGVGHSKADGSEAAVVGSLTRCDSMELRSESQPGFLVNVISVSDDEGPLQSSGKKVHSASVLAIAEAVNAGEPTPSSDFIRVSAKEVREVRPTDVKVTATELLQFYSTREAAELGEDSGIRTKIVHKEVVPNWISREGALISSLSRLPPALLSSSLSSLRERRHITVGGEF